MQTIPTLAIVSTERSGTNYLGSCLRQLDGAAAFFEIFADGAVYGMERYPDVAAEFSAMIGHQITGDKDNTLSRIMREAPVKHIKLLNHAAAKVGKSFFSYKIFPLHIDIPRAILALREPGVLPLFLVRRRIDCYISYAKALQSDVWENVDTTDIRPEIDIADFDTWSKERDHWFNRLHLRCQKEGLPSVVMQYETDIDVPRSKLSARLLRILHKAGVETHVVEDSDTKGTFKKQDRETDPFKKVKNGKQVRQALETAGRIAYATGCPLINSSGSAGRPQNVQYLNWRVINQPDLVSLSDFEIQYLPLVEQLFAKPEVVGDRPALHYLSPTWSLMSDSLAYLQATLARFHANFPKQRAIVLAPNEAEFKHLQDAGITTVICNCSVFQDEEQFQISNDLYPQLPETDAVYLARFRPFKRHELCSHLDRPYYIYDASAYVGLPKSDLDATLAEIRQMNPSSVFVNQVLGDGEHAHLDATQISRAFGSAKVSLCLSQVEGNMRASIQSLLCGLPIVSTPSSGGRDRYYNDDTALIVEPTAKAVRDGVEQLKTRRLSREAVRARVLSDLNKDRAAFIDSVNREAVALFGDTTPEITFEQFRNARFRPRAMSGFLDAIRQQA